MLVFAASDKGGTGRSVTSCNMLFRHALAGYDVCYLDFDFGSPTAGSIFQLESMPRGTTLGGLHSYLLGEVPEPHRVNVWNETDRAELRQPPPNCGRLVLLPGDEGGGEFPSGPDLVARCTRLLLRLEEEFDVSLIDLSAGRSYATDLVLRATADPRLAAVQARWLVFHRWTRQHIMAASGLVHGKRGIRATGRQLGHDDSLLDSLRFVRTAVVDLDSIELAGLRPEQIAWLRACNRELHELASRLRMGRTVALGTAPLDPLLQWREQLISDDDVWGRKIANAETVNAFQALATALMDEAAWKGL